MKNKKAKKHFTVRANFISTLWQSGMTTESQRQFLFYVANHCYHSVPKKERRKLLESAIKQLRKEFRPS